MSHEALRWEAIDAGGWHYHVGIEPSSRLLCCDTGTGAVALLLAGLCHDVMVLQADPVRRREIVNQAMLLGLTNVRVIAPESLDEIEDPNARFDGFVLHDPQANFLHRGNCAALVLLLSAVHRALRPGAFVYFGMRHRYGFDRLLAWLRVHHKDSPSAPLCSALSMAQLLRSAGFVDITRTPMLLDHQRVNEIISARGYTSIKNRFLLAERLKEIVVGQIGARWVAPFYGVVGFRQRPAPSFMDQLLQYLRTHNIGGITAPDQLILKRHFVLNGGKVVLSFGVHDAPHGGIIVILTQDAESARRRELEGEVLNVLARLPASLSVRIPKPLHTMTFLGVRCFALSELPGVTVDVPTRRLARIASNAARLLADLHLATLSSCRVTSVNYPDLFGDFFDEARYRYSELSTELSSLEKMLRQFVLDREYTCVRLHGDYKVENVMVDPSSDEITGIIDWELSRAAGPPLLDLIYLLVYNRVINGSDWYSAFQKIVIQHQRDPHEQAIWAQYLQRMSVSEAWIPVYGVLFAIHHIGCRLQIDLSRSGKKQEMYDMIQLLETVLQKQDERFISANQG